MSQQHKDPQLCFLFLFLLPDKNLNFPDCRLKRKGGFVKQKNFFFYKKMKKIFTPKNFILEFNFYSHFFYRIIISSHLPCWTQQCRFFLMENKRNFCKNCNNC